MDIRGGPIPAGYRFLVDTRIQMKLQQLRLEHRINATPTGPVREKLTEANIHMMASIFALKEALNLEFGSNHEEKKT